MRLTTNQLQILRHIGALYDWTKLKQNTSKMHESLPSKSLNHLNIHIYWIPFYLSLLLQRRQLEGNGDQFM